MKGLRIILGVFNIVIGGVFSYFFLIKMLNHIKYFSRNDMVEWVFSSDYREMSVVILFILFCLTTIIFVFPLVDKFWKQENESTSLSNVLGRISLCTTFVYAFFLWGVINLSDISLRFGKLSTIIISLSIFLTTAIYPILVNWGRKNKIVFVIMGINIFCVAFLLLGKVPKSQGTIINHEIEDVEGNTYKVVKINQEWWMAENLKTTKYNDGTSIDVSVNNKTWISTEKDKPMMSWYHNDIINKEKYGGLYNWYVVNSDKNGGKNVCPKGWKVASSSDWIALHSFISDQNLLQEKSTINSLKSRQGWHLDKNGVDDYDFAALPAGQCDSLGNFHELGSCGYWWASGSAILMHADSSSIRTDLPAMKSQFSIRCIKDLSL